MKSTPSPSRLLILDGIGGVPLGQEMTHAFQEHGISTRHQNCATMPPIPAYRLRSAFAKLINRSGEDSFFHLPRLDTRSIETLLRETRPECVLVIGFAYRFIAPATLAKLKQELGFSLFLYDTDSCNLYTRRREFIFFLETELPIYDLIFSFSRVTTEFFRRARGLNAQHQPFGAQPIQLPQVTTPALDALFVGSCDLRRIFLLEHICHHVSIYGSRWKRHLPLISPALQERIEDRPVWGTELHHLLASSRIILNITRGPFFGVETGINLRIFEALAAGRMLLTDHCDEVAELFRPGEEIETFRSAGELSEKTAYYLSNDAAREKIAKSGHQRFLANYSWKHRTAEMLQPMGLDSPQ